MSRVSMSIPAMSRPTEKHLLAGPGNRVERAAVPGEEPLGAAIVRQPGQDLGVADAAPRIKIRLVDQLADARATMTGSEGQFG